MSILPVRKYVKVWLKRRKNPPKQDGSRRISYTLQWTQFGEDRYLSLGPHGTLAFAKEAVRQKEAELNSFERGPSLDPISWTAFESKYLSTQYPGYDKAFKERKIAAKAWGKSLASMRSERLALANFGRLIKVEWVHEITTAERERFVAKRLTEVDSPASVDTDLRVLRAIFNVAEEWKHLPEHSNPFAGRGKATVGVRRRREKERGRKEPERHYTFDQVQRILRQTDKETRKQRTFESLRLRALIYFIAYTGCRFSEAAHLEWKDIQWNDGIAWLYFKIENDLKTEGSQAPFGLPDPLIDVLKQWEKSKTCDWVFPNERRTPWKSGGATYRPIDQLKALAKRADIKEATFKRFRHTLATIGKGRFGLTAEQIRAQLRHTTAETQAHYTHDDIASLRGAAKRINFSA